MILLKKLQFQLARKKNLHNNNNKVNIKSLFKDYHLMLLMAILETYSAHVEILPMSKWSIDQMVNQKVLLLLNFQLNQPLTKHLNLTVLNIWAEILEFNKLEETKDNKDQVKEDKEGKEGLIETSQPEMPTLKLLLFLLEVSLITQQPNQLNNYSLVLVKFNLLELLLINKPKNQEDSVM